MPNKTIYIRKEDEELWDSLENKAGKVSELLNNQPKFNKTSNQNEVGLPTSKNKPEALKSRFCKEGHPIPYPKDKCLGKGCRYS